MSIVSTGPTAAIEGPSIMSRPGANFLVGVSTTPASITIRPLLLTPGSQVTDDPSEIALGFVQTIFRFFPRASGRAHDDSHFQIGARSLNEAGGLIRFDT